MARTEILESEEITVAHDSKNPLPCPYEGCPHMKTKDSGGRTGLAPAQSAPAAQPASALSPVEADRKRRRRRTNSSMNDASTHQTIAAPPPPPPPPPAASSETSGSGPSPAPPVSTAPAPSTPPTQPPTPVKRQHRTPSKVLVAAAADGDDSQDGNQADEHEAGLGGAHDMHDNKKKLVGFRFVFI